jgi:hypothetical protein
MTAAVVECAWTERAVLDLLRDRYDQGAQVTRQWAYVEHVRAGAGWNGSTIDALAVGLWSSTKHEIHAFEVKCSRADLLRELRDPGKSVPWTSWADRFWLVAPRGVVRDIGELPNDWGLLEAGSTRLTAVRPAKLLRPLEVRDDTVTRERLATILAAMHRNVERPRR